jgi:gas vesicle protein
MMGGSSGAGIGGLIGSGLGALNWQAASGMAGAGNGLGTVLGSLFTNGGQSGGGIVSAIGGLFGLATGGMVSGPGTGTSDSIPTLLSNGEFVINAEQTAKHHSLLKAINSGSILKRAAGGIVGNVGGGIIMGNTAMMTAPSMGVHPSIAQSAQANKAANRQQSTFNINVTGDISQQTRREIQQMIPQIATGVNMHNYERGSRQ